jgi:hypothetical protein
MRAAEGRLRPPVLHEFSFAFSQAATGGCARGMTSSRVASRE